MSSKRQIKKKLQTHRDEETGNIIPGIPAPVLAKKYVEMLREYTDRNVIVYYSCYPRADHDDSSVAELDITGFMLAMQGLDPEKGLDLVMQTPGGSGVAAEGIVNYLQGVFKGDVRVIVPYCAYSAGTLISCAAKSIVMGKHSFLGPVDVQINHVPGMTIVQEFDEAREDIIANPNSFPYWQIRLSKYHPLFYSLAKDGIALSDELVKTWLTKYMFAGETGPEVEEKIDRICGKLNSNNYDHGRHFGYEFCKDLGLKVEELEADPELQRIVLGLHHALEFTIAKYGVGKVIMSQTGEMYLGPNIVPLQADDFASAEEEEE